MFRERVIGFPPSEDTLDIHQLEVERLGGIFGHESYKIQDTEGTKIISVNSWPSVIWRIVRPAKHRTKVEITDINGQIWDERRKDILFPYTGIFVEKKGVHKKRIVKHLFGTKVKDRKGRLKDNEKSTFEPLKMQYSDLDVEVTASPFEHEVDATTRLLETLDRDDLIDRKGRTRAERREQRGRRT